MDRRKFLTVAGCGALLGLTGCGGCGSKGGNVIKIVSSMPRTGWPQGQTDTIVNGIKMAIEEYGGEIAGMKIEYQTWTTRPPRAVSGRAEGGGQRQRGRADPDVMAFIGPYNSGAAKVSMPILNEAGLLQISPAVT